MKTEENAKKTVNEVQKKEFLRKSILKKRLKKVVVILLIVAGITGIVHAKERYDGYKSSIKAKYFMCDELKYVKDLSKTKEQTIKIDDYTITLKKVILDAKTGRGFAAMEFRKKGNGFEEKYNPVINDIYVDNRFELEGVLDVEYKIKDGVIYAYMELDTYSGEYNTLCIKDNDDRDERKPWREKYYMFDIEKASTAKEYVIDERTKITISSLALEIDRLYEGEDAKTLYDNNSEKEFSEILKDKDLDISIVYKNDEKKKLISSLDDVGCRTQMDENHAIVFADKPFKKYIDINKIDYILVNGKKYKENAKEKELKNIYDYENKYFNKEVIKKAGDLYNDEKQVIQIEDYTITLEKYIYDDYAKQGVVTVSYKKKDGVIDVDMDNWNIITKDIEDRFDIEPYYYEMEGYIQEDILYTTFTFDLYEKDAKLGIKDYNQLLEENEDTEDIYDDEEYKHKVYYFDIKGSKDIRKFEVDKNTIVTISPLATEVLLKKGDNYNNIDICAYDKKGNKIVLMKSYIDKDEECGRLGIDNETPYTEDYKEWLEVKKGKISYQDIHNDYMDIDEIEYITFNGEKITKSK